MVARLCGNFGISDLRLVQPIAEIDSEEARKFSTHSRELLLEAPVYEDLAAATADCGLVIGSSARFRDGELGAGLRPHEVPSFLARRPAARWALVFGNEADGLNTAELRCCQAWVHLDTFGPNASYNLANAVAITLYQIATVGMPDAVETAPAADRAHVDALFTYWLDTLDRFQYFRRASRERYAPLLGKMMATWHLTQHDVQAMRGMLGQMNYFAFGERFDGGKDDPAEDG
jgi:TrmH family RNA methyltransferase